MAAHKARIDAEAEGWLEAWLGNEAADDLAKLCRPCPGAYAHAWHRWQRARGKRAAAALAGLDPHPWQPLQVLQRLPKDARMRAAAAANVCHVPEWIAGGWCCRACGTRFRDAATAAAATAQACRAAFGGSFHASHAITTGVARGGAWLAGTPLAICRRCACYSAHQAVGLAKPCRSTTSGRKSRLTRFLAGRHPEPGFAHIVVDGITHFPKGRFVSGGAGDKRAAAIATGPPVGRRRLDGAPAADCSRTTAATLHEAAIFDLANATSPDGAAHEQEGQHPLSDAALASDPAVYFFAAGYDIEAADHGDEFALDVQGGLD